MKQISVNKFIELVCGYYSYESAIKLGETLFYSILTSDEWNGLTITIDSELYTEQDDIKALQLFQRKYITYE